MKRTLIVLVAALAVLAAILLKKHSDDKSLSRDVPILDSTRKASVASMRVIKKPDTANLQVKDGKWATRDGYAVDTSKINKVLRSIFDLQAKEMVSNSAARLGEYGLDSNEAKHVKIADASGQAMAEVVIGKTSGADYSSTYWKWESKPEVYRTPGNFTWEIATKDNDWKDRKLFAITAKDVKLIDVTWKDTTGVTYSYKLEATTDSTWKMLAPQDSNRVKNAMATEMATRLADMSVDEFVLPKDTNVAKVKLDTPAVWVKATLKNGSALELKGGTAMGGYVYTQHPTRKELIKLSSWRYDAYKKKPFELLDAPPAPKADTSHAAASGIKVEPAKAAPKASAAPAKPSAAAQKAATLPAPKPAMKPLEAKPAAAKPADAQAKSAQDKAAAPAK